MYLQAHFIKVQADLRKLRQTSQQGEGVQQRRQREQFHGDPASLCQSKTSNVGGSYRRQQPDNGKLDTVQ